MLARASRSTVLPGEELARGAAYSAGPGTYLSAEVQTAIATSSVDKHNANVQGTSPSASAAVAADNHSGGEEEVRVVRASVAGTVKIDSLNNVSVIPLRPLMPSPAVGDECVAVVQRISQTHADLVVQAVNGIPLDVATGEGIPGAVRLVDTIAPSLLQTDSKMRDFFGLGDIILGRIVAIDSSGSGLLISTIGDELGVVRGRGESGGVLRAVSVSEMECSITGVHEFRKVALLERPTFG